MSGAMQMLLATKSNSSGYDSLAWTAAASAGAGGVTLTITLNTDGTTSVAVSSGDILDDNGTTNWYTPTTANIGLSHWVTITDVGADLFTGTTTLFQLSSSKSMEITATLGTSKSCEALIEIFSDSGGSNKVTEITFPFTATA